MYFHLVWHWSEWFQTYIYFIRPERSKSSVRSLSVSLLVWMVLELPLLFQKVPVGVHVNLPVCGFVRERGIWSSGAESCFSFVFTKVFTAQLKNTLTRLKVFNQGPSSFNPQSRFPDHSAESTRRDCMASSELRPSCTPLRICDLIQKNGSNLYTTNPF